mmetsp:Transcript_4717/g.12091  ORF Transcript_4717/g.12091 Transcript_4717/m.12091 type:complete len:310 (+) Transcript_4717:2335-3264(+)
MSITGGGFPVMVLDSVSVPLDFPPSPGMLRVRAAVLSFPILPGTTATSSSLSLPDGGSALISGAVSVSVSFDFPLPKSPNFFLSATGGSAGFSVVEVVGLSAWGSLGFPFPKSPNFFFSFVPDVSAGSLSVAMASFVASSPLAASVPFDFPLPKNPNFLLLTLAVSLLSSGSISSVDSWVAVSVSFDLSLAKRPNLLGLGVVAVVVVASVLGAASEGFAFAAPNALARSATLGPVVVGLMITGSSDGFEATSKFFLGSSGTKLFVLTASLLFFTTAPFFRLLGIFFFLPPPSKPILMLFLSCESSYIMQ